MWTPPKELTTFLEAKFDAQFPIYMERQAAITGTTMAEMAARGLGGMVAGEVLERRAQHLEESWEERLDEVLDVLHRNGRLTPESEGWFKQWWVDHLSGMAQSMVKRVAEIPGNVPDAAREAQKAHGERLAARITNRASSRIHAFVAEQALGSVPGVRPGIQEGQSQPLAAVLGATDQKIIDALEAISPSAAKAYEQGVRDLGARDRLSYRGPVTEIREALRETLHVLGPDGEVKKQDWYEATGGRDKPTMAQRAKYALRARRASSEIERSVLGAIDKSEELSAGFVRDVYTRSNVSTHTDAGRSEAEKVYSLVQVSLSDLLGV